MPNGITILKIRLKDVVSTRTPYYTLMRIHIGKSVPLHLSHSDSFRVPLDFISIVHLLLFFFLCVCVYGVVCVCDSFSSFCLTRSQNKQCDTCVLRRIENGIASKIVYLSRYYFKYGFSACCQCFIQFVPIFAPFDSRIVWCLDARQYFFLFYIHLVGLEKKYNCCARKRVWKYKHSSTQKHSNSNWHLDSSNRLKIGMVFACILIVKCAICSVEWQSQILKCTHHRVL